MVEGCASNWRSLSGCVPLGAGTFLLVIYRSNVHVNAQFTESDISARYGV